MRMHETGRWLALGLLGVVAIDSGCSRDARLAGHQIRKNVTVRPVTHYGVTLDDKAAPERVAYVLLRAIRDDFLAKERQEREAALDRQFDLCAANVIAAKNNLRLSRDEFVYHVVHRWTPTVSHYVHNFETDWDQAKSRLVRAAPKTAKGADPSTTETEVLMEVDDPSGDGPARAVMVIYMAQDQGLWRVVHLGFDPQRRSIAKKTEDA